MPTVGRIVERYINSPKKEKASDAKKTEESSKDEESKPFSASTNPSAIDYSSLQVPSLWNGKPTLMETAKRIGFLNQPLPVGLTLSNGQTLQTNAEAHAFLLQQQRSFLG
jgi:hypothetical protein